MAATGSRKILILDDRVDVLKRFDNGESCRSIAAAVNCGQWFMQRAMHPEGVRLRFQDGHS